MRKIRSGAEESRIYDAQEKEIKKKYGKRAMEYANYGWGVDDHSVSTKVYVKPTMILSSCFEGKKIVHEWSEY